MADTDAASTSPAPEEKPAGPTEFLVSSAPHLATGETTRRIMYTVVAAMIPMFVASIILYGPRAVALTAVTVIACLLTEAVANKMRGRSLASLTDGSAIVTGMILAFSLPPGIHLYKAFLGGVVAIALAKAVFGGLGQNLFNPAMVGRAFLMVCFPAAMASWTAPMEWRETGATTDSVSAATPLDISATNAAAIGKGKRDETKDLPARMDLFLGKVGGSLGETSALAAMIGGLLLVLIGVADYRPVVGVLGSAALFALIANWANPELYQGPAFHLTSGAMMFGAFFIATDYVGAPITPTGRWIFGIGVGVLVMVIRLFGAYPEGFMFAILVMNAATPLIERWTVPTPFGGHVQTS